MKKFNKTPLAAAMGAAFISTFASTAVNAEANPFGMTELSSGYMQLAEAGKSTEMTCGANMKMDGTSMQKVPEKKCAGMKTPASGAKSPEGKCGEGKCGGMMNGDTMKPGMEGVCGAMMKGKEGKCGASAGKPNPK